MKKLIIIVLSAVLLCSFGCVPDFEADSRPVVAVSVVPEAAFVNAVCGDRVRIATAIPAGYSPENYAPTPREIALLENAVVYFSIGVPAEISTILPRIPSVKTVSLADAVSAVYPDRLIGAERDPHIWLSPKRAQVMVAKICEAMCTLDTENAEFYTANAADYIAQLVSLDAEISSLVASARSKSFIVFHPAFGYIADDYGMKMYALEEDGKEASLQHLADMVDFAKENNITAVFYQAETDGAQAKSFAAEIGGTASMLQPLSTDYINNLKAMASVIAQGAK